MIKVRKKHHYVFMTLQFLVKKYQLTIQDDGQNQVSAISYYFIIIFNDLCYSKNLLILYKSLKYVKNSA